jgi:hypothetical protein
VARWAKTALRSPPGSSPATIIGSRIPKNLVDVAVHPLQSRPSVICCGREAVVGSFPIADERDITTSPVSRIPTEHIGVLDMADDAAAAVAVADDASGILPWHQ